MWEQEDRSEDDQESVAYFIFLLIKLLLTSSFLFTKVSRFSSSFFSFSSPPLWVWIFFCGFGDHPYTDDLSLGYRR